MVVNPQEVRPSGLAEAEVESRRARLGYNEIIEERPNPVAAVSKRLWGPIPWMLEAALVLELVLGKVAEPAIIAAWLLFSVVVGAVQERRARRALELLRSRLQVTAQVLRDGHWQMRPARELVPDDSIRLRPGDLVPADSTIAAGSIEVDQSVLTGESAPVARKTGDTIYAASTIRRGEAVATVTATGPRSYYGRTAELVRAARSAGHLDRLLFAVVRQLVAIDAVLAVVLVAFAIGRGTPVLPLVPFLMVLVTATVPITMPAAFTVANAVEARALAKAGVLVTGLSAVQEAATMDVLCIDKTGTLTQNRQTVVGVVPVGDASEDDVLAWATAACDDSAASSLDRAILRAAAGRGVQRPQRERFVAFDPATKRSEALARRNGRTIRIVLGSPLIVGRLAAPVAGLAERVEELASAGARVLALAAGEGEGLTVRGLIALADTPREDAPALVRSLRALGIRILVVSGDTLATARAISRQLGLGERFGEVSAGMADPLGYDGFANCYPEDKFRLVQTLQRAGRITGMTGDGVNDAPALKQAEVGIAVDTASDVARASAQVVLTRPGLGDMVAVVSAGRRVYRRMLTWTITKIARTIELAALLTIGYIATGIFVTPLLLIAVLVVLNDIVTITLATDRAAISRVPEQWNVREIGELAGILAAGWLVVGFVLLWLAMHVLALPAPQIQTLVFVYLIDSAQATIYLTRVRRRCWSFAPSRFVAAVTLGNVIGASLLAGAGILMAAVPWVLLFGTLVIVLVVAIVLDQVKLWFLKEPELTP